MLVGQSVTLRYDPSAPPTRPLEVVHDGRVASLATILDAYAYATVKRARPSSWPIETDQPAPGPPPSPLTLRDLDQQQHTPENR